MRHYIRYGPDGDLVGCDIRTRGWPVTADPRDPASADPVAQGLRKKLKESGSHTGWVAYDCPCARDVSSCACPFTLQSNHYYNGVVLFPKPALLVEVDGVVIEGTAITVVPGATAQVVLRAAAPDGHTVEVADRPMAPVQLLDGPQTLSFSGGVSTALELTGPPQGIPGYINWKSKYVRECYLTVTGWA